MSATLPRRFEGRTFALKIVQFFVIIAPKIVQGKKNTGQVALIEPSRIGLASLYIQINWIPVAIIQNLGDTVYNGSHFPQLHSKML